ncbi:Lcl domain-containing protein [Winogradskyella wichelsiae]|uniref:Lcl domain-containing protein n=1 Tax=Winogradskyella wichelsiae TaxID=2697007 RepID=UPI003EF68242
MIKYFLFIICFGATLCAQENNHHLSATIIGSGSPKFSTERSGPSVLIAYKNTHILVDMGNGTQANLNKNNTKIKSIDGFLFTHHHLDHNEEFTPIFIQSLLGGNHIIVAGPKPTTTMVANILSIYEEDITYRLSKSGRRLSDVKSNFTAKNLTDNAPFYIGDIKITYTPVNHTIETFAYRFDAGNESIVISGDLSYSESLPILAQHADYLIMDAGGAVALGKKRNTTKSKNTKKRTTTSEKAHVNLAESSQMAKDAHAKNLVLTHFNSVSIDEVATSAEIRKNYLGTIIYGKDLMTLPLKENSITEQNITLKYSYPIVDTGVQDYYSDTAKISKPSVGDSFYGQDANYNGHQPSYTNNNDGTVTDNVTGLMWEQDMGTKMTLEEALKKAENTKLGEYNDWRVPTIKELYSLIQFTGKVKGATAIDLFIATDYFNQPLGDLKNGERQIDAQTWSSTAYVGKTMRSDETLFGVNFVDGRIKGYPKYQPKLGTENKMYFRLVRGNTAYGKNNFIDHGDGTVSDYATGLMWQKADDGIGKDWKDALAYSENIELAAHSDWRLPNAKELQSIVDYTRSPQTTDSPAIDPVFQSTQIKASNENLVHYPFYWTGTTHLDGQNPYASAVYIAFGEAQGQMKGRLMDVHGAGAQRSDPKSGNKQDYPQYFGPQGDVRYVYNYVRCVRDIHNITPTETTPQSVNKTEQAQQNEQKNKPQRLQNSVPSFQKMLTNMDSNTDGKLSKSEVKGKLKQNFDRRDQNKDGYITENEFTRRN